MLKRLGLWYLLILAGLSAGAAFGYPLMAKPSIWLGTIGRGFAAVDTPQIVVDFLEEHEPCR